MSSPAQQAASAEAKAAARDPYQYHDDDIAQPPRGMWNILQRIGPGMILAASIVGSGELIATTTLGAEAGYVALWIILLSCFVKPAVQAEMGRHTISTGETAMAMLDTVPGPRWRVSWVVWAAALMICATTMQLGAMLGGVAQTMNRLVPAVPIPAWVLMLAAFTLLLLLGGGYARIEKIATVKVALFTLLTALCAVLLTRRSDLFHWSDLSSGLTFDLPRGGLATAIAVFGITGVGASELLMYPYWCVEKGYARYAGRRDSSSEWRGRALGWIRVMHVDILATMVIYTLATIAFYLLGAGILNRQGLVPSAKDMIPVLSRIYTDTLGAWALPLFYLGAIATLYGTVFAATAAQSRILADFCRIAGLFPRTDLKAWYKWRDGFVWGLILVPTVLYLLIESPVQMVRFGGTAQALLLPILALSTLYLRYRRTPKEVEANWWFTTGLWIASGAIVALMSYYAVITWRG